jgi:uncharacterized protein (TIRG00374 family)
VVSDLVVYVCHGWRWTTLLAPVAQLRFWRTVQAIYIGLFANEVLPLRTGEVIRCYLLAHWHDLRLSLSFASAAVERIIDGIWMVAAFFVTAAFVNHIPEQIMWVVDGIGALLLLAVMALAWIVRHKQHTHTIMREKRWAAHLRHIIEGLQLMGNTRTLSLTVAISLLYLGLQVLTLWALMRAYGLDYSFWVAGGVLSVIRLATVIPNAPGNAGLVNVATVMALRMFELDLNDAKGFSIVYFVAQTGPLLIGGAIATALTGLNISELRDRARARAAQHQHHPHPDHPHPDTVA